MLHESPTDCASLSWMLSSVTLNCHVAYHSIQKCPGLLFVGVLFMFFFCLFLVQAVSVHELAWLYVSKVTSQCYRSLKVIVFSKKSLSDKVAYWAVLKLYWQLKETYLWENILLFHSVPKPITEVHYGLAWKLSWCNLYRQYLVPFEHI